MFEGLLVVNMSRKNADLESNTVLITINMSSGCSEV